MIDVACFTSPHATTYIHEMSMYVACFLGLSILYTIKLFDLYLYQVGGRAAHIVSPTRPRDGLRPAWKMCPQDLLRHPVS